jgi:ribosomal-protein-alanine N-acetyltransferase
MTILIETERLQMRKFTLDDVEDVFEFSTCLDVTRYTGDAGTVQSKQDAENLIKTVWLAEYEKYGYARYALIHKGDQKLIGFCGIKFEVELGLPDIGYRMMPAYWGKGLATEAVRAVLEYAHDVLGLEKIIGEVVDQNLASSKVLLKMGFRHVDTYEKDGFTINRYE